MLLSTPAIVLHVFPYSDTSVIARVFTRQLGMRSYIIKGRGGSRGRLRQSLLQPLSPLDMVVYDNHRTQLNHVKELSSRRPDMAADPISASLRFFAAEVLYKALREDEPMPALFDYVDTLDLNLRPSQFPVTFLLRTAAHLGIEPMDNYSAANPLFHLEEGRFVASTDELTLTADDSLLLHAHLAALHNSTVPPAAALERRQRLLDALIAYFQVHLSGFHNFKSSEILHEVLA